MMRVPGLRWRPQSGIAVVEAFAVGRELRACGCGGFQGVLERVSGGSYIGRSNLESIVSILRSRRGE